MNDSVKNVLQRYNDDGSVASDWELLYAIAIGDATASTITLSESAANFRFLVIMYNSESGQTVGGIRSTVVYNPDGKTVELNGNYDNGTYLYLCNAKYTISGTKITKSQEVRWRLTPSDSSAYNTRTSGTANLKIYAVAGIRGYTRLVT